MSNSAAIVPGVSFPAADSDRLPVIFVHTLLVAIQIGLLALLCAAAGVFTARLPVNEFFGHLLPGSILVAAGLAALVGRLPEQRLVEFEAGVQLAGGALYILVDTFIVHPPLGIFGNPKPPEQFHVGLMSLLCMSGLFALLAARRLRVVTTLHVVLPIAVFAVVISGHHQHHAGGEMSHTVSALLMGIAAVFRLLGRRIEYGVSLIAGAYVFFSGQMGLAAFVEDRGIDAVAWTCYWIAGAMAISGAYIALFHAPDRTAGRDR